MLAEEAGGATLDSMSGGRVELGIGVGWLKEEFEAMGVPFEKRGKRSDEYIAVMRKLWAEDGASFRGDFVSLDEVSSNPKPVNRSVPIVIGGHSKAAARRAGPVGQRLLPSIGLASRHGAAVRRRPAHGRSRRPRSRSRSRSWPAAPTCCPARRRTSAPPSRNRYVKGVTRIVLPVWRWGPDLEDSLGRFGEEAVIRPFSN